MANELKPCKVYWCLKEDPKRQYQLESTTGECLEEVGIPNRGRAVINRTIKPKVGDIVWCDNQFGTISGFYFNKAYNSYLCRNTNGLTSHLKADYFCSYGERKTNE